MERRPPTRAPRREPRGASARSRRTPPLALLALLLIGTAPSAEARPTAPSPPLHTALTAAYPAADTLHTTEIREIRLRYSTAVQPALSTITLVGPEGVVPGVGALEAVPGSEMQDIRVALAAPLLSGEYRVEWRTAGPDSHPINGSYGFSVEWEAPPPSPEPQDPVVMVPVSGEAAGSASGGADPRGVMTRTLFFLAIVGMLGTAAFRLLVSGPLAGDRVAGGLAAAAAGRIRALAWVAASLALLAVPARLTTQASELFGPGEMGVAAVSRLLGSGWGAAWWLQLAAAALFVVGLRRVGGREDRAGGWRLMFAAALGTALVPALSGHAAAIGGTLGGVAIANDALHVTAAGVWLGSLCVLVLAGLGTSGASAKAPTLVAVGEPAGDGNVTSSAERAAEPNPAEADAPAAGGPLARLVNAFSRVALPSALVLFATGAVSSWIQTGGPAALFTSGYGRVLLVKLLLVGAAAALGFYNWRVVRPSLERDPRAGLVRIPASVEMLLGLGVILVTAVLVSTPPPGP